MYRIVIAMCFCLLVLELKCQDVYDNKETYLNEPLPGLTPKIFAKGIISKQEIYEFGSAPDINAKEFYFAVRLNKDWKAEIRCTKLIGGKWTKPLRLDLDTAYTYNDPLLTKEGNRLYFVSNMPLVGKGEPKDFDIWYMERTKNGWSEPINAGNIINSPKNEFYVSISNSGSVYFVSNSHTETKEDEWDYDVYCAELIDGKYQEPVRLNEFINSSSFECDPYIDPDESFMIFCSTRPGGYGEGDLYISFKTKENKWSQAINMGKPINTEFHEFCPFVTYSGEWFFYTSNGDIHWLSAELINRLKENN